MPSPLAPDPSSIGVIDGFKRNFTKALYLRSQPSGECERGLGYGPGRLSQGWWLLFALERPTPDNFEFGGYTHFSAPASAIPASATPGQRWRRSCRRTWWPGAGAGNKGGAHRQAADHGP